MSFRIGSAFARAVPARFIATCFILRLHHPAPECQSYPAQTLTFYFLVLLFRKLLIIFLEQLLHTLQTSVLTSALPHSKTVYVGVITIIVSVVVTSQNYDGERLDMFTCRSIINKRLAFSWFHKDLVL